MNHKIYKDSVTFRLTLKIILLCLIFKKYSRTSPLDLCILLTTSPWGLSVS